MNENENSISIRWFFLPPFTALLTVFAANLFSTGRPVPVDPAVWGLVGLLFVVLSVLYALFIKQDFSRGLLPVQLIAQGLLLCPLALGLGARMLQWVGVTMAVCGAVVLLVFYHRFRFLSTRKIVVETAPSAEFSALPLPFAVTDAEGNIVFVSDTLLKMTNRTREKTEGEKITLLLPLDRETIVIADQEWKVLQVPMKNTPAEEPRYYFQLEEVPASRPQLLQTETTREAFVDPASTLSTRAYAEKRVKEELYRVRRYKRWTSAALLRMSFVTDGTENLREDGAFLAYCAFVREHTREADISCLLGPRDILVVMPETDLESAQEVAGKLSDCTEAALSALLADFSGKVEVRYGAAFFSAASGNLDFDSFLACLDQELEKAS